MLAVFVAGFSTSGALDSALSGRPYSAAFDAAVAITLLALHYWGRK